MPHVWALIINKQYESVCTLSIWQQHIIRTVSLTLTFINVIPSWYPHTATYRVGHRSLKYTFHSPSHSLPFQPLLSFYTLFVMFDKWYRFPSTVRRRSTHIHKTHKTHSHPPMPTLFRQGFPPSVVYRKCVFLSSVGLDEVMQLVLVSSPRPCTSTTETDREQCSVGRRGRPVTEMTQLPVAG